VSAEQKAALRARLGVGEAPLALYLGHIPHGSDLDLAIEALARLLPDLPQARLVIAGVGDGLPALETQAQAAGVVRQVIFAGDAVLNPYRDTLINRAKCAGKVVLAMAVGRAVITSRLGENLEYIEDGRSGILVEPGDVEDLARAMRAVLSDRAWAAELGRNARQRLWARYDWDARVGEVERIYQIARGGQDVTSTAGAAKR